jgi:Undecaprenyl-phosphate galactose phosphotransferase WbaP
METPSLSQLTKLLAQPASNLLPKKQVLMRKIGIGAAFFLIDMIVISSSMFLTLAINNLVLPNSIDTARYFAIIPVILPLFPLVFFIKGLYPGFGYSVIEEIRSLTISISIVYASIAALTFLMKGTEDYSRLSFVLSWFITLPLVPLGRSFIRKMFGKMSWWGIPVLIVGAGKAGENVINTLQKHTYLGLQPIVAVDEDPDKWGYLHKIPVIGGLNILPQLARKMNIEHVIIAMPGLARQRMKELIKHSSKIFKSTTVIPDMFGIPSLWISTKDLGGILGLEVQHNLLKKSSQFKKRLFDICASTFLLLMTLPFFIVLPLFILIDSKGKIFYTQKRVGINDSHFHIIKFRTMYKDAEKHLSKLLMQNRELREEFAATHKLRFDPRITRIGKFIRKFCLDELPQFINVIKGDMSLIGPRAIVDWEKDTLKGIDVILKVKPGLSGLWQVTPRNDSQFEEKNYLDLYYIRNWSIFLDIYIIARTIGVVFSGKGI